MTEDWRGSAGDEVVVVTRTGCGRWRAQQWRGVREENYGRDRDDRTETYSGMVAGRTVRLVENSLSFAVSRCLLFSRRERGWLAMRRSRGCKGAGLVAHVASIQTVKVTVKGCVVDNSNGDDDAPWVGRLELCCNSA